MFLICCEVPHTWCKCACLLQPCAPLDEFRHALAYPLLAACPGCTGVVGRMYHLAFKSPQLHSFFRLDAQMALTNLTLASTHFLGLAAAWQSVQGDDAMQGPL